MKARYLRLIFLVMAIGLFGALSCDDSGETDNVTPVTSPTERVGTPEAAAATPVATSTPTEEGEAVATPPPDLPGSSDYIDVPRPPGLFRIVAWNPPVPGEWEASSLTYKPSAVTDTYDIASFYTDEMPEHRWSLTSGRERQGCYSTPIGGSCYHEYILKFARKGADSVLLQQVEIRIEFSQYPEVDVTGRHPDLPEGDMSIFVEGG